MPGIWTKRGGTKRRARKISRAPFIVGHAPQVRITKTTLSGAAQKLSVAPISVDIYRFAVEQ